MKKLLCTIVLFFMASAAMLAQADIEITGNGTIITDGQTAISISDDTDFGSTNISTPVTKTFTVNNTGTATLFISLPPSLNDLGTGDTDWSVTTPSFSVDPGNSTSFDIIFNPSVGGAQTIELSLTSNDPDESPYTFNVGGTGVVVPVADIEVVGNGTIIVDGQTTTGASDDTDFGATNVGTPITRTFTINNTGTDGLFLSLPPGFNDLGSGTGDWSITNPPAFNVPIGGTTSFDVTFTPSVSGTQTVELTLSSSDPDESPFTFYLEGFGALPIAAEIDVTGNGNLIVDGQTAISVTDDTDYGSVSIGTPVVHTFTINNTGTIGLFVAPPVINDLGTGTTDWSIDASGVPFPVPASGSATFTVEFNPSIVGAQSVEISLASSDTDENPYTFNVGGEGIIAPTPEIEVVGNAVVLVDGQTVTAGADDTDFGTTTVGIPVTHTFTVNNTGTADLFLSLPPVFNDLGTGISDWSSTNPSFTVPASGTTTFDITFTPTVAGVQTVEFALSSNDSDESPFTFNVAGEGVLNEPEINISGNGTEIISGDVTPDVADDTDFGQADITSGTIVHTFTIQNTGPLDLNLTGASPYVTIGGTDPAEFSVTAVPSTPIASAGSTTFNITFNPTSLGVKVATISIANDDSDEDPYTFDVQGEGIDANAASPLLITQYYEGTGANDKWIEVTNVSNSTVLNGSYYLALYTDFFAIDGIINTTAPNQSIVIGTLAPGQVALYRNPSASTPGAPNLGTPTISATTNVCTFDGDDVILISSNNGVTAYDNRIDIMGVVGPSTGSTPDWGVDTAFIKGCGTSESPTTTFDATVNSPTDVDVNDYIRLSLTEVDTALAGTNIQLGTQGVGPTEWTTAWSNNIPDRTRSVIISGTYNATDGNIISCDMTITGNLNFDSGTTNYVEVDGDLNIVGTFTIGDNESLYMGTANQNAVITGSITKYETTTELKQYDFTYWGSPVANAAIATVFAGTSLGDVYYWDADEANVIPHGGEEPLGEWIVATGTMIPGNGYIALGPQGGSYPLFQTVAFTGKPNNGTVSLSGDTHMAETLDDGNEQTDFNVIGNPYPSAISADEFLSTNNVFLDETIWFWTHATANNLSQNSSQYSNSDYASYNYTGGVGTGSGSPVPDGTIASGQGFLVKVIDYDPIAKFTNKMRIRNQTGQFYRGTNEKNALAEKDRIWLNVESKTGGATSQMLVGFMDNATDGFDQGYDGVKNGAGWISIYSTVDDKKLAIQGLPAFSQDRVVPIGFDTYIDETVNYEISIDKVEGVLKESEVYLVDNVLNIVHDLNQAPYEFTMDTYEFNPDRFSLQFSKGTLGVDDATLDKDFVVINKENAFELRSNSVINTLKVYDVMGRLLMETTPEQSVFEVNTSSIRKGTVLVLLASFENGAEMSKKAIKY